MRVFRNQVDVTRLKLPGESGSNQRRKGRVRAELLQSNLGRVIDLSETGLRLERRGSYDLEPGATLLISLNGPDRSLACPAKVVWIKKSGWFSWQLGLEFLDSSDTFRRALRELSMACMDMRTFAADSEELASKAG